MQTDFRAMGTDVRFVLECDDAPIARAAFAAARTELDRLVSIFSRFDAASELSRLNRARAMRCSTELVEVLQLALEARRLTRGHFDPFVLPALRAAGYDRTYSEVVADPHPSTAPTPVTGDVVVESVHRIVRRRAGELDLGGVAKGWIADRLAEFLAGTAPALVDAGGDIACTPRRDGSSWRIAVEGCSDVIELTHGGVATSGMDRRRWRDPRTGEERHHVIDPRTGAPSRSHLHSVTCVAGDCTSAEIAATALLVSDGALSSELERTYGLQAHLVTSKELAA